MYNQVVSDLCCDLGLFVHLKQKNCYCFVIKTVLRLREIMKNILLPKYALIIVFVIVSLKRSFCNFCDLQKSQTICLTSMNGNMAWTAFSDDKTLFSSMVIPGVQQVW